MPELLHFPLTVLSNRDFLIAFLTGGGNLSLMKSAIFQSPESPGGAMLASIIFKSPFTLLMLSQVISNKPYLSAIALI